MKENDMVNKTMYQVLITSIYRGGIATSIAQVATEKEADDMVDRINKIKPEMMSRYAERIN